MSANSAVKCERQFRIVEFTRALPVGYAINDAGLVAGEVWDPARSCVRAAVVVNGVLHELPFLGGAFSRARGINNRGEVVGDALTVGDESHHAFLATGGTIYDLNDLIARGSGWELLHGLAINNNGTILAHGTKDGVDRLCLLLPTTGSHGATRPLVFSGDSQPGVSVGRCPRRTDK